METEAYKSNNLPDENPETATARDLIEHTGVNLFLTGKAGTGKTTFLRQLVRESPKRLIVLAPTGIAAINAGGMTIHSFFQLPFAPYIPGTAFNGDAKYRFHFSREKRNIIRSIDLLVIDEVSMVRADLLDAVDDVLRRFRRHDLPFGGVQLLLIGDVQQLPPVANNDTWSMLSPYYDSPYFFSSHALKQTPCCTIELKKVYRQNDARFLNMLNLIRENRCDASVLAELNSRYIPDFDPPQEEGYIRLTTHNHQAQLINREKLDALPGMSHTYKAIIKDDFPELSYPTDPELELKVGAQVMFIKNDISGAHRFVNGTIGEVTALSQHHIEVRTKKGEKPISVEPMEWANAKYVLDEKSNEIVEQIAGTFTQFPLKTAWAITIHKSQGLTFEHAIIDTSAAFAHGQTYVALSRCRSLEGMVLSAPLPASAIICDHIVREFAENVKKNTPTEAQCKELQREYFITLLHDLYDFISIENQLKHFTRLIDEFLYRIYPQLLEEYKYETVRFNTNLTLISPRFETQYRRIMATAADYTSDETLQTRLKQAATYFAEQLKPLGELIERSYPDTDNKELKKKLQQAKTDLQEAVNQRLSLLCHVAENGFDIPQYLRKKAILSLEQPQSKKKPSAQRLKATADIPHPALYRRLVEWRKHKAEELHHPAYMVLQQKAIMGLCQCMPENLKEMMKVPYMGKVTAEKYGSELLKLIDEERRNE